jgi:hypothetical protein
VGWGGGGIQTRWRHSGDERSTARQVARPSGQHLPPGRQKLKQTKTKTRECSGKHRGNVVMISAPDDDDGDDDNDGGDVCEDGDGDVVIMF